MKAYFSCLMELSGKNLDARPDIPELTGTWEVE